MLFNALSIKEPWASEIAYHGKTIETRTWAAPQRAIGEMLLICASARPSSAVSGHAVAIARLVGCRKMERADEYAAKCPWRADLWAWILDDVRAIATFPVRGAMRIFKVDLPNDVHDGVCRICGCTPLSPCLGPYGETCSWVFEEPPDPEGRALCSNPACQAAAGYVEAV